MIKCHVAAAIRPIVALRPETAAAGRAAHGTAADDGRIGEAWLLSDRDDHPSKVADGPLKGSTIRQLLEQSPDQLLGKLAGRFRKMTT